MFQSFRHRRPARGKKRLCRCGGFGVAHQDDACRSPVGSGGRKSQGGAQLFGSDHRRNRRVPEIRKCRGNQRQAVFQSRPLCNADSLKECESLDYSARNRYSCRRTLGGGSDDNQRRTQCRRPGNCKRKAGNQTGIRFNPFDDCQRCLGCPVHKRFQRPFKRFGYGVHGSFHRRQQHPERSAQPVIHFLCGVSGSSADILQFFDECLKPLDVVAEGKPRKRTADIKDFFGKRNLFR